jgi:lysophospholipase L1-like esterase
MTGVWRRLAAGLLVACGLLFILDVLFHLAAPILPPQIRVEPGFEDGDWFEYSAALGWKRRPNWSGLASGAFRRFDAQGYFQSDAAKLAAAGAARIVLLGDSTTFGYRLPLEQTFGELLDAYLPEAVVINFGVIGHTSYQTRMVLEAALRLRPALVIVATSFNDRRYVMRAEDADGAARFRSLARWQRVRSLLAHSYLYRILRLLLAGAVGANPRTVDLRTLPLRVPPAGYRENLEAIASEAKAGGARLVFLALRDNPFESAYLAEGLRLARAGLPDLAEVKLASAIGMSNAFSDLARIELASLHERDADAARRARAGAVARSVPYRSLHGGLPARTDAAYNAILREVAASAGVPVADAGELNGGDYLDFCHPNSRGHAKLARLLADLIRRQQLLSPARETAPVR